MIPCTGAAQSDHYLLQRINGASPEELCILLLEGAQKFLLQAIKATKEKNISEKARYVNRVSAIIEELTVQLNQESGTDLVVNLTRIYDWWMHELFEAASKNQPEILEKMYLQVGSMRESWEELVQKNLSQGVSQAPPLGVGGLSTEFIG